jgi:hypothetical protein
VGTLAVLVALEALSILVGRVVHPAWLATCIAFAVQGIAVAILAVALRNLVVPNPVWILLLINGAVNLCLLGSLVAAFGVLMKNSPQAVPLLFLGHRYPTDAPGFLVATGPYVPQFFVAAAAWSLRPSGKVFRTRWSKVAFAGFIIVVATIVLVGSWYAVVAAYAVAAVEGRYERVKAGDSIRLAGRAGELTVGQGWSGGVGTDADPPPRWLPPSPQWDLTPGPFLQSVVLTPTVAAETTRPPGTLGLAVYRSPRDWQARLAAERSRSIRFPLAEESFATSGVVAYSQTPTSTDGVRRTMVTVFFPGRESPSVLTIVVPHSEPATPTATIREWLRFYRPEAP